jgi:hypothetical protein
MDFAVVSDAMLPLLFLVVLMVTPVITASAAVEFAFQASLTMAVTAFYVKTETPPPVPPSANAARIPASVETMFGALIPPLPLPGDPSAPVGPSHPVSTSPIDSANAVNPVKKFFFIRILLCV